MNIITITVKMSSEFYVFLNAHLDFFLLWQFKTIILQEYKIKWLI